MNNESTMHIVIDSIPIGTSSIVDVLSALLVPAIAMFGGYIAYQQYKINKQRLKHELYERKLLIFKHMKTYLSEIFTTGKVTYDRAVKFNYDTSESTFLLDDVINKKIKTIFDKSMEMALLQEKIYPSDGSNGLPVGEERTHVVEEHSVLLKWLTDQLVELKPMFKKHLGL